MDKRNFTRPLITIGLLALVGAVGAQAYYTHELANRVAAADSEPVAAESRGTPSDAGAWDPWATMHVEMMRMRADMDQMFNHSFQNTHNLSGNSMIPSGGKVSLEEQGDNFVVKADIPGAKESDIQVNLDGRMLSISAQTQGTEEQKSDNGQVLHEESFASSFQRAFTLPSPVNATGMHSQFHDGVLTVTIPKATS